MPEGAKTPREGAERIFLSASQRTPTGGGAENVVAAIVGVGYALLAIHDELAAIRRHVVPPPGPHAAATHPALT